jgi:hypothetical protein
MKYVNYLKWRKTYILVYNKQYLTKKGLLKIKKYAQSFVASNSAVAGCTRVSNDLSSLKPCSRNFSTTCSLKSDYSHDLNPH